MATKPLAGALCLLLFAAADSATAVAAQESSEPRIIYQREVFQYPRSGRPDPFRSLVGSGALGLRVEDLTLRGVVHDPDPRESVAIFTVAGTDRRIRARVGDRIGTIRVLAIQPRRVEVLIEEFGVPRRETLELRTTPDAGAGL